MKWCSSVLLILLLLSCGQQKEGKPADQNLSMGSHQLQDSVDQIRKFIKQIDELKISDSIELENEDFMQSLPDGGASLSGYFHGGELVKIKEWFGLSYGVVIRTFYFDKSQVVKVHESGDYFYTDDSIGIDHSRFGEHYKGDFYISHNRLIHQVDLGHKRFKGEDTDPVKELVSTASEYRTLLLRNRQLQKQ